MRSIRECFRKELQQLPQGLGAGGIPEVQQGSLLQTLKNSSSPGNLSAIRLKAPVWCMPGWCSSSILLPEPLQAAAVSHLEILDCHPDLC